jgi:hypothetical protein
MHKHGCMARGGHGLPKVSSGPAIKWASPETAVRAGSGRALDTPRRVPMRHTRRDGEFDSEIRPRDRLDVRRELELWELVDEFVKRLRHLRYSDQLSDFVRAQVVETFPWVMRLLNFFDYFFGNFLANKINQLATIKQQYFHSSLNFMFQFSKTRKNRSLTTLDEST